MLSPVKIAAPWRDPPTAGKTAAPRQRSAVVPGDPHPCGRVMQDVPGTAQGCWFVEGTTSTYPEDPHLALVWSNHDPLECVVSCGTSVAGFGTSARSPWREVFART